ncbi:hypothetical protein C725_2098 [Pacificimonas flava]|uniref:Uncharacterized protein n=1 Tax=Pacificimonas flava TaxID=1234595 RepID=M2U328_9SPHN|nr:hypothetical protein C725_2098 [Pacificimonas flava]
MHGTIGLLLDDDGSIANISACDDIADLDLDQVTAAQLAVDGEVEKCFVPQSAFAVEMEADRPDLFLS